MGISDYFRVVYECNLVFEILFKYSKVFIKRVRCYEGLNRLELVLRDLNIVLVMELNNLIVLELIERVKQVIESRGDTGFDYFFFECIEFFCVLFFFGVIKDKISEKKSIKGDEGDKMEDTIEKKVEYKGKKKKLELKVENKLEYMKQMEIED